MPPDRIFCEVVWAMTWRATGMLPAASLYEMDCRDAQTLLTLKQQAQADGLW